MTRKETYGVLFGSTAGVCVYTEHREREIVQYQGARTEKKKRK